MVVYAVGSDVDQVEVTALGPDATAPMGFVASVPYEGAQQAEAKSWVESNVPNVQSGAPVETDFGGVHYTLSGNSDGGAYTLEIGTLGD